MTVKKRNYSYPDIAPIKRVLGSANVTKIVNSHYPRLMIDALHKKFVEKQDWKKAEAVAALEKYLNKATEKQARRSAKNPRRKSSDELLDMQLVAQHARTAATEAAQRYGYQSPQHKQTEDAYKTASRRFQRAKARQAQRRNGFGTNLAASMIAPIAMEAVEKASKSLQYGAKKVTTGKGKKNPDVRHKDTKELGTILGIRPGGWVKVKWENHTRPTLIKDDEIIILKGNPSVRDMSEMFQGKASGKSEDLKAASTAPANLSRAGKFAWLKIEGRRLPLRAPGAVVAIDTKGRLWLAGKHAPMFTKKARKGEGLDYGEIESIAYITAKAHIGDGKTFEYVHEFGEEGGRRPHLIIDDEGMPIIKGGDYTIRSEGIIN